MTYTDWREATEAELLQLSSLIEAAHLVLDLKLMSAQRKLERLLYEIGAAERVRSTQDTTVLANEHLALSRLLRELQSPQGRQEFVFDSVRPWCEERGIL